VKLALGATKLTAGILARASQIGLTISDQTQFTNLANIDVVLVNKAGTLTSTARRVAKMRLAVGSPLTLETEVLALAAGVELNIAHPIAESIVREARRRQLDIPEVLDARVIPGLGVTGFLEGETITVGGPGLLTTRNIPIYVDDLVRSDAANQAGHTILYVLKAAQLIGMIELRESVLPESIDAVRSVHAQKVRVAMVTGDATGVAEQVAKELGIAEVFAEIVPSKKADVVRKLKTDGSRVAMAASLELESMALAEAHVGVAINSTGIKSTSAGLYLADSSMESIAATILLAKKFKRGRFVKRAVLLSLAMLSLIALVVIFIPR
jgi:Cu2+-exporting ATPase